MNVLNRIIGIVLFLLLLAIAVAAIAIVTGLVTATAVDQVVTYAPIHHMTTDLEALTMSTKALVIAAAVIVGLISLWLLGLELRPPRRPRKMTLSTDSGGEVDIRHDVIRQVARQASLDVAGVEDVDIDVARRRESIRVKCRATIDRFADATAVGSQVETSIRQRLEQMLGRPVERVDVDVEPAKPGTPVHVR